MSANCFNDALQCCKVYARSQYVLRVDGQYIASREVLPGAVVIKEPYEGVTECKLHLWFMRKLVSLEPVPGA